MNLGRKPTTWWMQGVTFSAATLLVYLALSLFLQSLSKEALHAAQHAADSGNTELAHMHSRRAEALTPNPSALFCCASQARTLRAGMPPPAALDSEAPRTRGRPNNGPPTFRASNPFASLLAALALTIFVRAMLARNRKRSTAISATRSALVSWAAVLAFIVALYCA